MLKVQNITIEGINGLKYLNLDFNEGFNFISGSNGVGKTTILDCVACTFNRHLKNVRPNVQSISGLIKISVYNNGFETKEFKVNKVDDSEKNRFENRIISKEIVNFDIARTTPFKIYYRNTADFIQGWFYKNYYRDKKLSEKSYRNLQIAKRCFELLDNNVSFSRVVQRGWKENHSQRLNNKPVLADMFINTNQGEIPLDYLSSGYKSCLILLLGIIKQTEVTSGIKDVHSFEGVILIDEIDLHLHPEWQAKLIDILRWLVPNAQIIATTHSPHIIQVAEPQEIIPLGLSLEGEIIKREIDSSKYGFQGWSVEEILTDVMGMRNTHSDTYLHAIDEFNQAVLGLRSKKAHSAFNEITKMLHPNNHLRKILKIQMAPLEDIDYDQN